MSSPEERIYLFDGGIWHSPIVDGIKHLQDKENGDQQHSNEEEMLDNDRSSKKTRDDILEGEKGKGGDRGKSMVDKESSSVTRVRNWDDTELDIVPPIMKLYKPEITD